MYSCMQIPLLQDAYAVQNFVSTIFEQVKRDMSYLNQVHVSHETHDQFILYKNLYSDYCLHNGM